MPEHDVLTAEEVATLLRVNKDTVWRLARNKEIPSFRVGSRRMRFYRKDIEEYIERQRQVEQES